MGKCSRVRVRITDRSLKGMGRRRKGGKETIRGEGCQERKDGSDL